MYTLYSLSTNCLQHHLVSGLPLPLVRQAQLVRLAEHAAVSNARREEVAGVSARLCRQRAAFGQHRARRQEDRDLFANPTSTLGLFQGHNILTII